VAPQEEQEEQEEQEQPAEPALWAREAAAALPLEAQVPTEAHPAKSAAAWSSKVLVKLVEMAMEI
jgi:hypothetical protein